MTPALFTCLVEEVVGRRQSPVPATVYFSARNPNAAIAPNSRYIPRPYTQAG